GKSLSTKACYAPNAAAVVSSRANHRTRCSRSGAKFPKWHNSRLGKHHFNSELSMSRQLRIAAAQLGPLHLSDTRTSATNRLVNLLRAAHGTGAKFVVFPELAFTTFFPRYWYEDLAEVDRRFFEFTMPS